MSHIPSSGGPGRRNRLTDRHPDPWARRQRVRRYLDADRPPPQSRAGARLKGFVLWVIIIGGLSLGYSYRYELGTAAERVTTNLTGAPAGYRLGEAMAFEAHPDGHFYVRAEVNGTPIDFLVDTGATQLALTPRDAQRLGLDPRRLTYSGRAMTANGPSAVAPVMLAEVRAGDVAATRVPAIVSTVDFGRSLLGMSFLNKIGGFEVRDGRLLLYP